MKHIPVDQVFILHCVEGHNRQKYIDNILQNYDNSNIQIMNTTKKLDTFITESSEYTSPYNKQEKNLNCILKFYEILNIAYEMNYNNIIYMEDNVILNYDVFDYYLENLPTDYDYILLTPYDNIQNSEELKLVKLTDDVILNQLCSSWSTKILIMSRKMIKMYIDFINKIKTIFVLDWPQMNLCALISNKYDKHGWDSWLSHNELYNKELLNIYNTCNIYINAKKSFDIDNTLSLRQNILS